MLTDVPLDTHIAGCWRCQRVEDPCPTGIRLAEQEARADARARDREYWVCRRKSQYRTRRSAARHAREQRRLSGDPTIYPYRCPYCEKFHIGHRPGLREILAV